MSSLNLVPNPTVMVVQAGIFVANFIAIKKLLLEPYLKVYDQRRNLTVGNKTAATRILEENESTMTRIRESLDSAGEEAASIRLDLTQAAKQKRTELITDAEQSAKATIAQIRAEIAATMASERKKLPSTIEDMTNLIVKQVLTT